MPNIIIIHGTSGSPNGNWFPWLKSELEKLNIKLTIIKNAGHINSESGYDKFEWLLKKIRKLK